jgi:CHRD domain-containing protein
MDPQGGLNMRVFAGMAATAILVAACGGTAAPSPAAVATASPTPSPSPTASNVFKAELKSANENPPIADAESTCAGTATVTLNPTSVKFDVTITGCPATTAINIGHIHEGAAGVNGGVKISTGLAAGDLTLTGGGATFSKTATPAGPPAWDAALITAIMANPAGYYVNFHSGAHTGGVIRGQLTKG